MASRSAPAASRAASPGLRKAPSSEAVAAALPLRKAPSKEAIAGSARKLAKAVHACFPAAAPAMKAALVKALPTRGKVIKTALKFKAKAKAKALPTRGAVKAGAKPKAVAAKEFAGMAVKLKKSRSTGALPGAGKWFFMSDLRKMKAGADDSKAWSPFSPKMSKALEMAFTKKFKQYTMKFGDKQYVVKFKSMIQFRTDDKSLQRPVKRE